MVMSSPTTWSVALCTYNGQRFLAEQLASIAAQTRLPNELVVVDDASTDRTLQILHSFSRSAPFPTRVLELPVNIGSRGAFERCIRATQGDLVALCDQDDVWYSDKLETMTEVFVSNTDVGLVFSDADVIDARGARQGYTAWATDQVAFRGNRRADFSAETAFTMLLEGNLVTGAAAAFRGRYRDLVLPFPSLDSSDGPWKLHDGWIAVLLAAVCRVWPEDRALLAYRLHADQQLGLSRVVSDEPPRRTCTWSSHENMRARFEIRLERLLLVRERLRMHEGAHLPAAPAVGRLDDEVEHLRHRLQAAPLSRRLPSIVRELRRGGYARYSAGGLGALRHLSGL